jgi:hypothetical protein
MRAESRRGRRVLWRAMVGLVAVATLHACGSGDGAGSGASATRPAPTATTTTTPRADGLLGAACNGPLATSDAGHATDPRLRELSGLVASRRQPGVLWAVNDSGDTARVYALDVDGTLLGSFVLSGVTATDWEDLAIGPGPDRDHDYLYVGDIGDSRGAGLAERTEIALYRVVEPTIARDRVANDEALGPVETFPLHYADRPRDIETLLVDPITGEVLLVHKSWSGTGEAIVYRADLGASGTPVTLVQVERLALAAGAQVTSGDVSPAGDVLALRTYTQVLLYRRPPGTTLEAALAAPPCARPGPDERQGESITFAAGADALYTVSEGEKPVIHRLVARA